MAEFEIRGGAGPYEAAVIVAVFNRLLAEAADSRAVRPALPRPVAWVRAYQNPHPDDPTPDVLPDSRKPSGR